MEYHCEDNCHTKPQENFISDLGRKKERSTSYDRSHDPTRIPIEEGRLKRGHYFLSRKLRTYVFWKSGFDLINPPSISRTWILSDLNNFNRATRS